MTHTETYVETLKKVLRLGETRDVRNGTTLALFGEVMEFDLRRGFPLMTCRALNVRWPAIELEWMLQGRSDIDWLQARGIHIWDPWENTLANRWDLKSMRGDLGRVYGAQWRHFGQYAGGTDQIRMLLEEMEKNPGSRRLLISAWSPNELDDMALPPCHVLFQFWVQDGRLNLIVFQRSMDLPIGGPHDIAQFALLLSAIAKVMGLCPCMLKVVVGDCHVYANQVEKMKEMLYRDPWLPDPHLEDDGIPTREPGEDPFYRLLRFSGEKVKVSGYDPHPAMKLEVSP
jgi:thymidylate synthase